MIWRASSPRPGVRTVLDTNILISALLFREETTGILRAIKEGAASTIGNPAGTQGVSAGPIHDSCSPSSSIPSRRGFSSRSRVWFSLLNSQQTWISWISVSGPTAKFNLIAPGGFVVIDLFAGAPEGDIHHVLQDKAPVIRRCPRECLNKGMIGTSERQIVSNIL